MYKTIAIIKPDAVDRNLTGAILNRIETAKFEILRLQMLVPTYAKLEEHYQEHRGKDFYIPLLESMVGRIVVVGLIHRVEPAFTVEILRTIIGESKEYHDFGTIRGDYAIDRRRNSIHGSSDDTAAEVETNLWFPEGML